MAESTNKPVVDPVKMPKLKTDAKTLAALNTWSLAAAIFIGFAGMFSAISLFTKGDWVFTPAISDIFLSGNSSIAPFALLCTLGATALGLFGILTIGKITDADALKKNWKHVFHVCLFLLGFYVLHLVVLILEALIMIGKSSGTRIQKTIWLNGFLPSIIMALGTGALAFLARTIAGGKIANARIASFLGIGFGGVAFILAFIATMVLIYG